MQLLTTIFADNWWLLSSSFGHDSRFPVTTLTTHAGGDIEPIYIIADTGTPRQPVSGHVFSWYLIIARNSWYRSGSVNWKQHAAHCRTFYCEREVQWFVPCVNVRRYYPNLIGGWYWLTSISSSICFLRSDVHLSLSACPRIACFYPSPIVFRQSIRPSVQPDVSGHPSVVQKAWRTSDGSSVLPTIHHSAILPSVRPSCCPAIIS